MATKKTISDNSYEELLLSLKKLEKNSEMQIEQLMQLSLIIYQQNKLISDSEGTLLNEFKNFHSTSPQKSMVVIFQKFFKDMVKLLTNFDDLLKGTGQGKDNEPANSWIKSVKLLQLNLETILKDWGLEEIKVREGEDIFNPENHEAVVDTEETDSQHISDDTIIRVVKRGWRLHNFIIQYPQVIVK